MANITEAAAGSPQPAAVFLLATRARFCKDSPVAAFNANTAGRIRVNPQCDLGISKSVIFP